MTPISLTRQANAWSAETGDRPKAKIGIRIARGSISNQLILLLNGLDRHRDRIDAFAITKSREFEAHRAWYERELGGFRMIVYSDSEHDLLGHLDAIILPESNHDIYGEFPRDVVKIGLPHGVDIPLHQTVIAYGGGYCFDYVLAARSISKPDPTCFQDIFPVELRNHSRNHVCEIPFGFPKLDGFIEEVTSQAGKKPPSIVYHLSSLGIENPGSLKLIRPTLKKLLENFPGHRIVFRPIMADRNHPLISECRRMGASYGNFHFSDAESYIPDYAGAAAMVCHRAYRLHLFGLATGRRTFLCHPDGEPTPSDDPTVTTCPESRLVDMLKAYVDRAEAVTLSQRMDICHQAGIHHPGSSIAYLVAHIDDIIAGNIRPEWAYYPLAPDPDGVGSKTHMVLQLASARMANMALLAFSGKYPENREILLFIADSYARTDFMPRYFYQLSLSHFHALTEQASLPSLLKIRAARWWQRRGRHMLDFMLAEAESDSKLLTREITSLRDGYAKIACDEALAGLEDTEFTDLKTLIDLRTLALVDYTGPLSLYGAKKLARAFLACRDVASVDIRSIVDPDPDAQGKELGGLIVQDPASLVESRIPVLICSYDHLPDIFMRLHRSLGGDRALYAICKDRHIADFLPLIAAASLRIN